MLLKYMWIKNFITALLLLLLSLPTYSAHYFSEYLNSIKNSHAGFVCSHDRADSNPNSPDDNEQHPTLCHELDVPCEMSFSHSYSYSPAFSKISSSYKGALLSGYLSVIDIPPELFG